MPSGRRRRPPPRLHPAEWINAFHPLRHPSRIPHEQQLLHFQDRRDTRRRHRQGSHARRPARRAGRRPALWHRAGNDHHRLGQLRLLRCPRKNDARRLESATVRHGRHPLRRSGLAGQRARPCLAVGLVAQVPPRVRPVHQPAPSCACSKAYPARWQAASPATSTTTWCARTPRASTRHSAASCTKEPNREIVIQESVYSPPRCQPPAEVRLRPGPEPPKEARDPGQPKSNGIAISMPWWDQRADEVAKAYLRHHARQAAHRHPHCPLRTAAGPLRRGGPPPTCLATFLSDLGPATTGTIGLAPSANLKPRAQLFRACSSRCTARRPISTARTSPTQSQ